ncbi:glutathione synthase [Nitrosomonas cryotolerans]|uniref:Glutathione synthetase n=1 Tax=Nitrosomonas cryotolerans ATCC 49181 TaxID=1131553 RepID=A0A1N6IBK0_9PROT|nr:glutathione synthase [Nitrosomonas cryotolerans]SFP61448.1 glutathione synthase [Nitrosomonas cryotolerans]SIO29384.1 glutathione synthase [Nitrosomonas cryotolerans ATCC 49181]
MKLAFILDQLDSIKTSKDTSFAMIREAAIRNHQLFVLHQNDLVWKDGLVVGFARTLALTGKSNHHWYQTGKPTEIPLQEFDIVLMRKDPPFNMEYVYSTYLLELAEKQGAHIINSPSGIRDHNEKLAIAKYPQFIAPTLVTSQESLIRDFLDTHRDIILKPLDGMGGASIFRVHSADHNISVILETLTHYGTRTIMAQRYLSEISQGDKRIILIAGKAMPYALARIPKSGETRGNLAAGGTGIAQLLTQRDKEIAKTLGPALYDQGLMLVGLDVIGDALTEINVTSPTGMQEITNQTGLNVAEIMIKEIEKLKE